MRKSPQRSAVSECGQPCANQECRGCKQCQRFHDNDLRVFQHPETTQEDRQRLAQETIGDFNELVHEDKVLCAGEIDAWISVLSKHQCGKKCARRCRCRTGVPMKYCVNDTKK